jgi:hypothetical protein
MIKHLKLQKALYAVILGVMCLIASQVMHKLDVKGANFMLGFSGAMLIIGAFLFLYPILFAKKVDIDGKKVELEPIEKNKELNDDELIA